MKEHGVGKRKSSYTFEQLEQVFGQGGWDAQPCQPVLINSSGLYQELESDGSAMEEYSQEDWGNHSQDLHGYPTDQELGKNAGVCAAPASVSVPLCAPGLLPLPPSHQARSRWTRSPASALRSALNSQLVLAVGHLVIWEPADFLNTQNCSFGATREAR